MKDSIVKLVSSHAALCEHVDLLCRQLKLYQKPGDTATQHLITEGQTLVREGKRIVTHDERRKE